MTTTQHPPTAQHDHSDRAAEMRAIIQTRYGTSEVLSVGTVERPAPSPDEVLIDVRAAAVDRGTCHLMTGTPYLIRLAGYGITKPKNPIPGLDVAGRVIAVGTNVTRFAPGDDVFGIANGSLAEFAVANEEKLSAKPANVSFEEAAASAVSGITALQALTDVGQVKPGQHVLIVGASGGVGSFAVQLAKALGAEVSAVASTRNLNLVRSLGADHAIDYTRHDFTLSDHRYDLILDIGGRNSVSRLRSVLTSTGTLVIVGGEGGNRITGGIGRQLRAVMLSPFVSQRLTMFISTEHHSYIDRLASFLQEGTVVPAIGACLPLERAATAIAKLEAGQASGKTVIVIDSAAPGATR